MDNTAQNTRSRRFYPRRSTRRKNRIAKRLRFLLQGLKIIDAFGSPAEKLVIALIQECVSQIWPESQGASCNPEPPVRRHIAAVSLRVPSGNIRAI
jgi:hypothetical protein